MPKTKPTRRNGRTPTPRTDNRIDLAAALIAKADEQQSHAKPASAPTEATVESHPLPKLALSAAAMALQKFKQEMGAIAQQTVEAMGLSDADAWDVDFDAGTVSRRVPSKG